MATAKELLEIHKLAIQVYTEEDFINPHGTPEEIASDARRIEAHLKTDAPILIEAGLAAIHPESFGDKITCFIDVDADLETAVSSESAIRADWKVGEKQGYTLNREMKRHMNFLYRNNPELMAELKEIAEGAGRGDMVLDLKKYSTLGKNNPELLATAPLFEMSWLDDASILHDKLTLLLGEYESAPGETNELKILKKQVFTWMESSLKEIRDFAKYVFWDQPDKLDAYKRDYWKK